MNPVRDTATMFHRLAIMRLRNPVWMAVGFSSPLLYLLLFTPLLDSVPGYSGHGTGHVLDMFLPGIISLLGFSNGVSSGFTTIFELQSGVTERLRVTPASRFALLLGPILFGVVSTYVFDGILVLVGMAFGFHVHLVGLAVFAVLLGLLVIAFSAFSTAVALMTKEISGFAATVNGINLPLLLLAGVLLPLSLGPAWLRVLGHFDPLYYLVVASRTLAAGNLGDPATWQAVAVMVPLCGVTLAWANRVFRKAVS